LVAVVFAAAGDSRARPALRGQALHAFPTRAELVTGTREKKTPRFDDASVAPSSSRATAADA
jgi:hypothetical protein